MRLHNTQYRFSFFSSLLNTKPDSQLWDVNQLIEVVRYGYLREKIQNLRAAHGTPKYDAIKKNDLPVVTISGHFTQRSNNALVKHSGLLQLDLDNVINYDELFNKLISDPYTYVCFRSPGGKGIKVIVKIDRDVKNHSKAFASLFRYYKKHFNVEPDRQCKDVSRGMILSWDPDLFCNPFSLSYIWLEDELIVNDVKTVYKKPFKSKLRRSDDTVGTVEKILSEIENQKLDITEDYHDWFRIGCALSATFGESGRTYFHRFSQFYSDYNRAQTDAMYSSIVKRNDGRIKLGTLVYIARQHGVGKMGESFIR